LHSFAKAAKDKGYSVSGTASICRARGFEVCAAANAPSRSALADIIGPATERVITGAMGAKDNGATAKENIMTAFY